MAKVVIKHPGFNAEVHDVDLEKDILYFLRSVVGGSIELVRLSPEWDMYVNEEGKLLGLQSNMMFPNDVIVGSIVVTGHKGAETVGLHHRDLDAICRFLDACAISKDEL